MFFGSLDRRLLAPGREGLDIETLTTCPRGTSLGQKHASRPAIQFYLDDKPRQDLHFGDRQSHWPPTLEIDSNRNISTSGNSETRKLPMKTERRHDLETNELARYTAEGIEKVKPFSGQLLGVALFVVGGFILYSFWNSSNDSKAAAAWTDYFLAFSTTDQEMVNLQRVALNDRHGGTVMQEWAHVTWADRQTALASYQYLSDREATQERLATVSSIYEELIKGATEPQVVNRARFGLGRVYEMQNRLEDARKLYDQVEGNFEMIARERSDNLLKPEIQEACAWLASAELPASPSVGASGDKPLFDVNVPETGGVSSRSLDEILGFGGNDSADQRYGDAEDQGEETEVDAIFQEEESAASNSSDEQDAEAETAEP